MFDNISVADKLPYSQEMIDLGLDKNNRDFQTKDLDCSLSEYCIQHGELFEKKYKNQRWIKADPKGKSFADRAGRMERIDEYWDKVNFHGVVHFYNNEYDVQDKWDCWIEFKAIFTDSRLDRIELFKFEKTDNQGRKEQSKKWGEIGSRK